MALNVGLMESQELLVTALQGAGPFTVLAPTDASFAAALTTLCTTRQELLLRADLADILKYHVISGSRIMAAGLGGTQSPATLAGPKVRNAKCANAVLKFATATVTTADVECGNDVIHVIDAVVFPPAKQADIVDAAQGTGTHTVLVGALSNAILWQDATCQSLSSQPSARVQLISCSG